MCIIYMGLVQLGKQAKAYFRKYIGLDELEMHLSLLVPGKSVLSLSSQSDSVSSLEPSEFSRILLPVRPLMPVAAGRRGFSGCMLCPHRGTGLNLTVTL